MSRTLNESLASLNAATGCDFEPTLNGDELKGWHEGSKVYLGVDELRDLAAAAEFLALWLEGEHR